MILLPVHTVYSETNGAERSQGLDGVGDFFYLNQSDDEDIADGE